MKIIFGNTKTTDLIKMANNQTKLIVCFSREECHRVFEYANRIGANIHLPITYEEMIKKRYSSRNIKSLLLDDMDNFLNYCAGGKLEAVSISSDFKNKTA
jgi:hypothetical protein